MPALDLEFIFILDDRNWKAVRKCTHEAIEKVRAKIVYSAEIISREGDNTHPGDIGLPANEFSDWNNGYFLGVLVQDV
jgi:hypothetical protein